ncbi:MAG: hypothetical protein ACD_30C00092G0034 [uncultured bacterium]|uniref:Ribbon-helix-helix protein CopG domain-containing protein n=2 Tax=Candidatus Daviesiibacteriota TaxID=1752718 RepID=A0A0G0I1R1_9BACT|nr:MAG: hypothetical protein ACD_30C00092G0034 [uncultured bacterium]KKQ10051.1 MAG: hypothetical protein US19_C0009G0053 [Candidatus Daviesbacteria bacterium GW2011_GWB1_36_5]KKQ15937.1 MAG: hypothetical protein US28_C0007G0028 [Candidatus Daviesbacteria bacterium GW2011_GWA1_36_8]OGE30778.1 MAG: hypothetical protein A3C99_00520 [Candidatus Daviesbacteria bacterium RIFCSPHIGHO2_02_FULL_37_9]
MTTVTISLPDEVAKRVDVEAKKKGFATRSEFVRSLLREHFTEEEEELELVPFVKRPLEEIRASLEATGKYNKKFIDSVIKGLKENSSVYADKTSKS